MKRDDALCILTEHRADLQREFGVKSLALFGSVARDQATEASDVDLLVEFDRLTGLFGLIRLQAYLGHLFDGPVDAGAPDNLKPRIRAKVLAESIPVN